MAYPIGSRILCIDNTFCADLLTKGKIYTVARPDKRMFTFTHVPCSWVIADDGEGFKAKDSRFVIAYQEEDI